MNNNGVDAVSDPKMQTSNEAIAAEEKQNGNESAMRNITNSSMAGKCDMNGVDSIPSPNGASSLHQTASNESIDAGASSSKTTSNWFIDFVDDMRKMMRNRTFALQSIAQGKTLLTSTRVTRPQRASVANSLRWFLLRSSHLLFMFATS